MPRLYIAGHRACTTTDHPEDSVRSTAGLVHFGFTKVSELLATVEQLQNMLCTSDNVLAQTSHMNAALFALMDLQLCLV
jgi:hypothetical protein